MNLFKKGKKERRYVLSKLWISGWLDMHKFVLCQETKLAVVESAAHS